MLAAWSLCQHRQDKAAQLIAHLHTCEIMVFQKRLVHAKKGGALAVVSRYYSIPHIIAMPWISPHHNSVPVLMLLKAVPDEGAISSTDTIVCLDQVALVRIP